MKLAIVPDSYLYKSAVCPQNSPPRSRAPPSCCSTTARCASDWSAVVPHPPRLCSVRAASCRSNHDKTISDQARKGDQTKKDRQPNAFLQVAAEVLQEVVAGSAAACEALRHPDAVAAFQQVPTSAWRDVMLGDGGSVMAPVRDDKRTPSAAPPSEFWHRSEDTQPPCRPSSPVPCVFDGGRVRAATVRLKLVLASCRGADGAVRGAAHKAPGHEWFIVM